MTRSRIGAGPPPSAQRTHPSRIELRQDLDGVAVLVEDHPQSHVCLRDPGLLTFEYVQHVALALGSMRPAAPAPLRVTHVGGGGLTLARWVQHTRPGSPQVVLEPDVELTAMVRARLPLPRGHRIRVRPVGGLEGAAALRDASADVVVLDAFAGGRVPAELTTREWFAEVARILAPGGILAANVADEPGLRYLARVLASIVAAGVGGPVGREDRPGWGSFGPVVLVGSHEVLKGRRFGNMVVVAATQPRPGPSRDAGLDLAALRRAAAAAPTPTGVRWGQAPAGLASSARPFTGCDRQASPEPPAPGSWRVR